MKLFGYRIAKESEINDEVHSRTKKMAQGLIKCEGDLEQAKSAIDSKVFEVKELCNQIDALNIKIADLHESKAVVASLKLIKEYLTKDKPDQMLVNQLYIQRQKSQQESFSHRGRLSGLGGIFGNFLV